MRSEREARSALRLRASRAFKAKEHCEAREAGSRSPVEHAKVVQIPIDAVKAREASSFRGEHELPGERLAFREEHRHSNGEAMLRGLECATHSSW